MTSHVIERYVRSMLWYRSYRYDREEVECSGKEFVLFVRKRLAQTHHGDGEVELDSLEDDKIVVDLCGGSSMIVVE